MAESIISEVVSSIIKKLGSKAYKETMYAKDLDFHIKRLKDLKTTIEATIRDASSLESCTNAQKDVLEKLDCALADLDYFLDVKEAKAKQKEVMRGNKLIKEVRLFFSKSNQLVSSFKDARELKAIVEKFEAISRDHVMVSDIISVPSVNTKTQMVSTESIWSKCQILTEVVIGRDNDRDKIVNMLLYDSLSSQPFSVVSIVGIGGVGKTTLAKYVYHDNRVKSRFDVHLWVSTTQDFDVEKILMKILSNFKHQMNADYNLVQMFDCFKQEIIGGKKFLLVLDNVWDHESLWRKWQDLKVLLALGANGSKVLLTTRNEKVARMDCANPFVLRDLNQEDSWLLFKKIALAQYQDPRFEAIGKEIVKMCPNVPLAIRSIGGLLAMKCTVNEWLAFKDDQLANFSTYGRDIIQTLKLSYDQLDERLKLCVLYCSLFPKGYEFSEQELICLWISLGYIKPSYEGQQLENAAEECILMLTMQGFLNVCDELRIFPWITGQPTPDECSFSMRMIVPDMMYDLVVDCADYKYKIADPHENVFDERIRHLSFRQLRSTNGLSSILKLKHLQSLLILGRSFTCSIFCFYKKIFFVFPRLRILSLSKMGIEKVPSSLGELIALRYLDLSYNPITRLPNSITQLVELLSLNVSFCKKLDEFPNDIKKLVELRHLRCCFCPALIPKGLLCLKNLQRLDYFPLKIREGFPRENECGLAELNIIINRLTGGIQIHFNGDASFRSFKFNEERLESIGDLKVLAIHFEDGSPKGDEMLMEGLQPHTNNLRKLFIKGNKGERLPKWMKNEIHYLANLVHISFSKCQGLRILGSFGMLLHLKNLYCYKLENLEYMEEYCCGDTIPNGPLFPSLEELHLGRVPKLKKWYKLSNGESSSNSSLQHQHNILLQLKPGFPKLKELSVQNLEVLTLMTREFRGFSSLKCLRIFDCKDVEAIPDIVEILNSSNLEALLLWNCSEKLRKRCEEPIGEDWPLIKHIPELYTI